jgi:hypothetical protein
MRASELNYYFQPCRRIEPIQRKLQFANVQYKTVDRTMVSIMEKPIRFTFPNGRDALAVHVQQTGELQAALHALRLHRERPVLVLVGGAGKMEIEARNRLYSLFVEGLIPAVKALDATVVDGGTDAGVMRLMGQVRARVSGVFPLIGVAAVGTIASPDEPNPPRNAALLEPHHSHFVLVPGTHWGDESPWLSAVADALSVGACSVTVLINGGDIAWKDVEQSVKASRPVIVISGSGRTADALSRALRGEVVDERAKRLLTSELLRVIDVTGDFDELRDLICTMLSPEA